MTIEWGDCASSRASVAILAIVRQIPVAEGPEQAAGFFAEEWLPNDENAGPSQVLNPLRHGFEVSRLHEIRLVRSAVRPRVGDEKRQRGDGKRRAECGILKHLVELACGGKPFLATVPRPGITNDRRGIGGIIPKFVIVGGKKVRSLCEYLPKPRRPVSMYPDNCGKIPLRALEDHAYATGNGPTDRQGTPGHRTRFSRQGATQPGSRSIGPAHGTLGVLALAKTGGQQHRKWFLLKRRQLCRQRGETGVGLRLSVG